MSNPTPRPVGLLDALLAMTTRARCRAAWEAGARQTADSSPPAAGAAPGWEACACGSSSWRRLHFPPSHPLSTRLPVHLHRVSAGRGPAALDVSDALILGRCGHCTARHRLLQRPALLPTSSRQDAGLTLDLSLCSRSSDCPGVLPHFYPNGAPVSSIFPSRFLPSPV